MNSIIFEEENEDEEGNFCKDIPNLDKLVKEGIISSSTAE